MPAAVPSTTSRSARRSSGSSESVGSIRAPVATPCTAPLSDLAALSSRVIGIPPELNSGATPLVSHDERPGSQYCQPFPNRPSDILSRLRNDGRTRSLCADFMTEEDQFELLYGPYPPPALNLGGRFICLCRDTRKMGTSRTSPIVVRTGRAAGTVGGRGHGARTPGPTPLRGRLVHSSPPNGIPRLTLVRSRASSASVCGRFTTSSQSVGQAHAVR